jgi:hypothetical protein
MPESPVRFEATTSDLLGQALRYVRGELDPGAVEAFESRLADDQAWRDAVCRAVLLRRQHEGMPPPRPDPRYRLRVRARLLTLAAGHSPVSSCRL